MQPNSYSQPNSAYAEPFNETFLESEDFEQFNLAMPDEKLSALFIKSLNDDVNYWNQKPWNLQDTDNENVSFLLGDQLDPKTFTRKDDDYPDNRMFSATRAILAYATGSLARPEITPSKSDDQYIKMAESIQSALYQHAADEQVDQLTRAAVLNLLVRKRGYLKLRYDPNAGVYGDVVTENCNPEDVVIDRYAQFMKNPNKIYHRLHMTIDEACARWPKMANQIKTSFGIIQGRQSQMSRMVHPWECWFSYTDLKGKPREGVMWFLHEQSLILDKCPNPNWMYTGNDKKDKEENVTTMPPKPFVYFNYLTMGHSFIDETCLFEQAKPQQILLNRRNQQFGRNVDLQNGRWIASRKAFGEEDATKFVNKGAKTVALVNAEDVGKAMQVLTPNTMAPQVYESIQDYRNEIDVMMGTPSIFKGDNPSAQNTATRDLMQKQQAGMLQDDLVRAVQYGMEMYYEILLQMMRVYYTDDYWFQTKGGDGKFDFVMLNGDSIDSNVKIGVQVDSTLPLDKASIRATAMQLAEMNRIDQLTLLKDLGLPDPEIRTERFLRSQIDLYTYMQSIEQSLDNNDAEVDIMLLTAGKTPEERDNYDQGYLEYFNHFITLNRFAQLPQDAKQRIIAFLMAIQHVATQTANMQSSMLNDAGIINRPPIFPLPKRTENIRINATADPQQSSQLIQGEGQMFQPIGPAQQAQDPNQAAAAQASQGAATQAQPQQ